jgi:hypothetical protein
MVIAIRWLVNLAVNKSYIFLMYSSGHCSIGRSYYNSWVSIAHSCMSFHQLFA